MVEEMVFKRFHKYLKIFEKDSERILIRKLWVYIIDLKEEYMPKKEKIYPLSRIEKEEVWKFLKNQSRNIFDYQSYYKYY